MLVLVPADDDHSSPFEHSRSNGRAKRTKHVHWSEAFHTIILMMVCPTACCPCLIPRCPYSILSPPHHVMLFLTLVQALLIWLLLQERCEEPSCLNHNHPHHVIPHCLLPTFLSGVDDLYYIVPSSSLVERTMRRIILSEPLDQIILILIPRCPSFIILSPISHHVVLSLDSHTSSTCCIAPLFGNDVLSCIFFRVLSWAWGNNVKNHSLNHSIQSSWSYTSLPSFTILSPISISCYAMLNAYPYIWFSFLSSLGLVHDDQ